MKYKEIRLSGSGGQGIILMGIILAEAAIMNGDNAYNPNHTVQRLGVGLVGQRLL